MFFLFSSAQRKNSIVFLILLFFSLILMTLGNHQIVLTAKEAQGFFLYPFQVISRSLGTLLTNSFHNKHDKDLETTVVKLQEQMMQYQKALSEQISYKEENIQLRKLLELKPQLNHDSIVAEIVGYDPNDRYSYLTINKGRIDGVARNLPVVTFYKDKKVVVGLVSQASVFTSQVKTLKTEDLEFGITLSSTHTQGIVEGGASELKLLYINKQIDLKIGEEVYTSNLSELFPPNILVGTVISIDTTNKIVMSQQAYVKPAVNLSQISKVFVLKPKILEKK